MKHMQSFYIAAGKWSCYALSLVAVAKKWWESHREDKFPYEETEALLMAIEKKYIDFKEIDYLWEGNFTVRYPELFLGKMTGGTWNVRREPSDYVPSENEYVIDFYAKSQENANKGIGHFVFEVNSLQQSETVRVGKIYSKRVCKKIK